MLRTWISGLDVFEWSERIDRILYGLDPNSRPDVNIYIKDISFVENYTVTRKVIILHLHFYYSRSTSDCNKNLAHYLTFYCKKSLNMEYNYESKIKTIIEINNCASWVIEKHVGKNNIKMPMYFIILMLFFSCSL